MAESSEFTPDESRLHALWGEAWSTVRTSDPAEPTLMAETFVSVATTVFASVCGWATAAARLRYVANRFEAQAGGTTSEAVSPFVLCQEHFRQTAKALSDDGQPANAIIDGLMCLGVNSAVAFAGRDATVGALEDLIQTVKEKGAVERLLN